MEKVENMQNQMKDETCKKSSNINARNKSHSNK